MSDANTNMPRIFQQEVVYKECRHNLAASVGRICYDGCLEFVKSGEDSTEEALRCDACGCHRNFHRRETHYSSTTKIQIILDTSASAPPIPSPSSFRAQRRQNLRNNNAEEAELEPPRRTRRTRRTRRRQQEASNEQSSCTTKE